MVWGKEFINKHNDTVIHVFVNMYLMRKICFQNQQEHVKSTLVTGIKHVKAGNTLYNTTKSIYQASLNAPHLFCCLQKIGGNRNMFKNNLPIQLQELLKHVG